MPSYKIIDLVCDEKFNATVEREFPSEKEASDQLKFFHDGGCTGGRVVEVLGDSSIKELPAKS